MDRLTVKVKIRSESGYLPSYETEGSAGMDIAAFIKDDLTLYPGKTAVITTGLYIELPAYYEAQVRARSGLAAKHGIGLVNGIGTIDSDYRGEIKIILINWGHEPFTIKNGDRIAQLVIAGYEKAEWEESEILGETKRSGGGFGHTGI